MSIEVIHDRRSTDKQMGRQYATMEVDDPYAPGEKITVVRQLRHDQLAWYHAHGQIDEAQYLAGRSYQRDYEAAERGAKAIDPTREHVDGGPGIDPLPISQITARTKLVAIEGVLGRYLISILQAVLIHGSKLDSLARTQTKSDRAQIGRMFRMGLELLAVEYRLSGKGYTRKHEQPEMV